MVKDAVFHRDDEGLQAPAHAASILGIAVGCTLYVIAHRIADPLFVYLPQTSAWATEAPPGVIAMGYYGMVPFGFIGFVLGWALAKIPAVEAWLGRGGTRMLTAFAAAAIGGALLYHVGVELTGHLES